MLAFPGQRRDLGRAGECGWGGRVMGHSMAEGVQVEEVTVGRQREQEVGLRPGSYVGSNPFPWEARSSFWPCLFAET